MDALEIEGLLELVQGRQDAVPADTFPFTAEPELPPILLAISDNGPQMTSSSTREFIGHVRDRPTLRPARHPHRSVQEVDVREDLPEPVDLPLAVSDLRLRYRVRFLSVRIGLGGTKLPRSSPASSS